MKTRSNIVSPVNILPRRGRRTYSGDALSSDAWRSNVLRWDLRVGLVLTVIGILLLGGGPPLGHSLLDLSLLPLRAQKTSVEAPPRSFAVPHVAAQPPHLSAHTIAHLPLVAASADLRSDDILREPAIPSVWTPDAEWVLGGPAMAVDASGDVGFYGIGAHLVAMDLSGDGAPEPIGYSPPLPGQVSDVVVRDGTAFVTVAQIRALDGMPGGLFTLDVSDPTALRVMGIGPINGGANSLAVDGDRALVISAIPGWGYSSAQPRFHGLSLFDVSDPSAPRRVARWPERDLFGSFVSDAVIHESLAFVCDDELFALDLESDAYPIKVSPRTECSHVTIDRERGRLVVVHDWITTLALDEPRRIGDTLVLEEIGRSPLFDPGLEFPPHPRIMDADLEDGRLLVGGALGRTDGRGFLQRLEIAGAEPADRRLTFTEDDVPLGVALHDDLALTAGARDGSGVAAHVVDVMDNGLVHALGGAAAVHHESSPGELGRRGALVGPGTVVVRFFAHDGALHLIDLSPYAFDVGLLDERQTQATFWTFDVAGAFPRLIGSIDFRHRFGTRAKLTTAAATEHALFFSESEAISSTLVIDIRDGVPREVERLPVGGPIAAKGDVLYVMTSDNALQVYDVEDPAAPVLISPVTLESLGLTSIDTVTTMAAGGDLLWLGTRPEFGGPWSATSTVRKVGAAAAEPITWLAALDVKDPLLPHLAGSLEIESEPVASPYINVFSLIVDGDRAIVVGLGAVRGVDGSVRTTSTHAMTIDAPRTSSHPEIVGTFDAPPMWGSDLIRPFTSSAAGGRLWLGSPHFPEIVESSHEFGLIAVDLDGSPELEMTGAYRLPAALLARMTGNFDPLLEVFEDLQLDGAGERLWVMRLEGGVAAIDTRFELPRWRPAYDRE